MPLSFDIVRQDTVRMERHAVPPAARALVGDEAPVFPGYELRPRTATIYRLEVTKRNGAVNETMTLAQGLTLSELREAFEDALDKAAAHARL